MSFSVHDSGKRLTFTTGMMRDTAEDKPRFDLIFPLDQEFNDQLFVRLANHMRLGALKYSERNWEKANTPEELERFKISAFRHFIQWFLEVDDGEDHAAAVLFNINGAEYTKQQLENKKNETISSRTNARLSRIQFPCFSFRSRKAKRNGA
jgi:Domain of unknown function (DUF5664)